MNNLMELPKRLQTLREKNNFSQEKLAEELGISRQAISKWENGQSKPDIENIVKLSDLYMISTDKILKGVDLPSSIANHDIKQKRNDYSKIIKILLLIGGITLIALAFLVLFPMLLIKLLRGA